MTGVTLRFQSTGTVPGAGAPVRMRGGGMTVGRGAENDLVLPDPDRMLSKRHCALEMRGGDVVVLDLSTNGTFLNYGRIPLGPTPTPLSDGDVLSMGPYELQVCIEGAAPAGPPDPLDEAPVSHGAAGPSAVDLLDGPGAGGDFLDDLLGGPDLPTGPGGVARPDPADDGLLPPLDADDLLAPAPDPHAGQGASVPEHAPATTDAFSPPPVGGGVAAIPEDWDDLLAPEGAEDDAGPFYETFPPRRPGDSAPEPRPDAPYYETFPPRRPGAPPPEPQPDQPPMADPAGDDTAVPDAAASDPAADGIAPPAAPAAAPPAGGGEAGARAFLGALGIAPEAVPEDDLMPAMARLGRVLRIMTEGLREILMTRTSIKSEFRIAQTTIRPGGNNPLKFSVSPEQALEAMVRPGVRGYLEADAAAEEALRDVKAHEVAMVTGMQAALKGVLARLDPEALEGRIQSGGGLGGLLKSRKARYWEVYEEMYAQIAAEAEEDFQTLFAREFARAYQDQLERLK